ncbi:MAG: gamma-glutamyltransferase [Gammaproteobacteria bacterium]|nr:gamma-glutamyltransferase [Gammaproteobacteria bacterium]
MSEGIVAAGHPRTAAAAAEILADGGNAFDAVVAAHFAACVAEPVLASLGGGGFLLARTARGERHLYDFFTQTPRRKRTEEEIDFRPILVDFGTATQEFHIGLGSMACPGSVKGLFRIRDELGRLPMTRLVEPAVRLAREGVPLNALQAYILDIVGGIYIADPDVLEIFSARRDPSRLVRHRERLRLPRLADTLEVLAREGEALFYRGEIGQRLIADSRDRGGHLGPSDLSGYRVHRRRPLAIDYRGARIYTNPAPSAGGMLIAFGLRLLEAAGPLLGPFGSPGHLDRLVAAMEATSAARAEVEALADPAQRSRELLGGTLLRRYRDAVVGRPACHRGTTHVSVLDAEGNEASMTVSNGEGAGYAIPGTGIVMNNMLGEEDLNPGGFHTWRHDMRMASMMAPTLLARGDGTDVVLGSGGSNRIRTAILQVLVNIVDFEMPVARAVTRPRLHLENERLSVEPGFGDAGVAHLVGRYPEAQVWNERNLFFGGVHAVARDRRTGKLSGGGDPRRGGVCLRIVPERGKGLRG